MDTEKTPRTDWLDRKLHERGIISDRYGEMREHAQKLERELNEWKSAADLGSGCDTPDGLRRFITCLG